MKNRLLIIFLLSHQVQVKNIPRSTINYKNVWNFTENAFSYQFIDKGRNANIAHPSNLLLGWHTAARNIWDYFTSILAPIF